MGAPLTDGAEVLLRQIHPDLVQDGTPASSAFRPKESDKNKLSVDRGAMTTAAAAFDLFTSNGYTSIAVYGISVAEFGACDIPCEDDPLPAEGEKMANPAHALASFEKFGGSKQKTLGQRIKRAAIARGILHPIDASADAGDEIGDQHS
jgi:hypothetical protein